MKFPLGPIREQVLTDIEILHIVLLKVNSFKNCPIPKVTFSPELVQLGIFYHYTNWFIIRKEFWLTNS